MIYAQSLLLLIFYPSILLKINVNKHITQINAESLLYVTSKLPIAGDYVAAYRNLVLVLVVEICIPSLHHQGISFIIVNVKLRMDE